MLARRDAAASASSPPLTALILASDKNGGVHSNYSLPESQADGGRFDTPMPGTHEARRFANVAAGLLHTDRVPAYALPSVSLSSSIARTGR
jgi:hypothetical protein